MTTVTRMMAASRRHKRRQLQGCVPDKPHPCDVIVIVIIIVIAIIIVIVIVNLIVIVILIVIIIVIVIIVIEAWVILR